MVEDIVHVIYNSEMFAVGVFVTAPFFIVAPGVIALSHVYIFRTIFNKYGMKEDEKLCQSCQ